MKGFFRTDFSRTSQKMITALLKLRLVTSSAILKFTDFGVQLFATLLKEIGLDELLSWANSIETIANPAPNHRFIQSLNKISSSSPFRQETNLKD